MMAVSESNIHLEKWYLDCITDSGEAFIGYIAFLKWKRFKVPYSSTIFLDKNLNRDISTRLTKPILPCIEGDKITWKDPKLYIHGNWERDQPSIEAVLHDGIQGCLKWNCYQPRSKTNISFRGKNYSGYGYAEMLLLTDFPWNIDMNSLRWGRFCSNKDNLVWIQIIGSSKREWLWYNSIQVDNFIIDDHQVILTDFDITLTLDQSGIIESEQKIFNTVKSIIRYLPGFDKIVPMRFLYADETKWRSRGNLIQSDNMVSQGWAIHEFVDFR